MGRPAPAWARELGDGLVPRHRYPLTAGLLLGALATMPAWSDAPVGRLAVVTVGRVWLVLTVAALAFESRRPGDRRRALRHGLHGPAIPLLAGGALALVLIVISSHTNGCQCSGGLYGFAELEAWAALALLAVVLEPALAGALLLGAVLGAVVAGLLALGGVHASGEVNAGTRRLVGSYGNPNFLAATQALVVPIALVAAWDPRRMFGSRPRLVLWRWLAAVSCGVLLVVNFFTFSRAGLIAMLAGAYLTVMLLLPSRRARLWGVAAAVVGLAASALLYSAYTNIRTSADFGTSARGLRDPRTWETIATGLIGGGPSKLSDPSRGVLAFTATGPEQGVSYPLPPLGAGVSYRLRFAASSPAPGAVLSFGMEDDQLASGPVQQTLRMSTTPRTATLSWSPTRSSTLPRAYFWTSHPGTITLRSLTIEVLGRGLPRLTPGTPRAARGRRPAAGRIRLVALRVVKPPTAVRTIRSLQSLNQAEARFVRLRQSLLTLAITAFLDHPLRGIGWERFPFYSASKLQAAPAATHDEFTRYPAELGIGGLLAILALGVGAVWAVFVARRRRFGPALAGMLLATAILLAFANLLETPNASLAMAVVVAVAVGTAVPSRDGGPALAAEPGAEATDESVEAESGAEPDRSAEPGPASGLGPGAESFVGER